MTLEVIYFISQVIAAVALVLSLIFVGIQIRQNTEQAKRNEAATKAAAAESAHQALIEWQRSITPELATIAVKANTDFDSLSPEEVFLMGTVITRLLLSMQEAHAKWLDGSLVDSRWRVWNEYAAFSVSPAVLKIWNQRRSMFSDEFQAFFDRKIAEGPANGKLHMHNFVPKEQTDSVPDASSDETAEKESDA